MKITCHCGAPIFDGTDALPHKAHVIADQDWFATLEAVDAQVRRAAARGASADAACQGAYEAIGRAARSVWQCPHCGRLYVSDTESTLQCYVPHDEQTSRQVLRGRGERA